MRAKRVDAGQAALREAWRAMGGSWLSIYPEQGGEPDALVGWQGMDQLIEVKAPLGPKGGKSGLSRSLRPGQKKWHAAWKGRPVCTVRTYHDLCLIFFDMLMSGVRPPSAKGGGA